MWIFSRIDMAMKHHTYTRMIGILKISLPLMALAVLGTVFLITKDDGFDPGFTFSQAEFDALESGSYLDNPQINGKTENGDVFSLTAERIEPETRELQRIIAINLVSNFEFASGVSAEIIADTAEILMGGKLLVFPDGARIITSDGYDGTLETLTANLETGQISGEMIKADGPLGHISAEIFHISSVGDGSSENRVLRFEKAVKVTLDTTE